MPRGWSPAGDVAALTAALSDVLTDAAVRAELTAAAPRVLESLIHGIEQRRRRWTC